MLLRFQLLEKFKRTAIVYKQVLDKDHHTSIIAELECQRGQVFQSQNGSKCRTSEAKVLALYDLDHNILDDTIGYSICEPDFAYNVGEVVKAASYWEPIGECNSGIHFFLTFEEAVKY